MRQAFTEEELDAMADQLVEELNQKRSIPVVKDWADIERYMALTDCVWKAADWAPEGITIWVPISRADIQPGDRIKELEE